MYDFCNKEMKLSCTICHFGHKIPGRLRQYKTYVSLSLRLVLTVVLTLLGTAKK